jgi:2,4-dienoyl-CoA reductase (NADPH2)
MAMFGKPRFNRLISPLSIKEVKLRNRMVKLAASMGVAKEDGQVSDLNLYFYETVAKGGTSLVIIEHGFVDFPLGVTGPGRLANSDDKYLPGLTKLAKVIHKSDTPCFIQLGHAGPAQWKKVPQQPVSSSSLGRAESPHPHYGQSKELSTSEIKGLVEKFARGAQRAKKAGFDGVELHGAHNYLINSFLSCAWNKRHDSYGCEDLENRTRFVVEIIRAIREFVGENFVIGVRVNGAEYGVKGALTSQESQGIAKILELAGADYLSVSAWGFGPYNRLIYPEQILYPEPEVSLARKVRRPGALVPLAAAIKRVVAIPVIAAGRLDAELGEWILKKDMADLIGLNRRFFADPEYASKVATGRLEDIAPCTGCLECLSRVEQGQPIRCRINAAFGRGYEFKIKPAERRKKVIVVGGGPAGMEAARVAAIRGHEVSLYEKGKKLGGLIPLAAMIKGTEVEALPDVCRYLERQVRKLGVQIKLGTEVNAALIKEAKPDVVIIATGGLPATPEIPGIKRSNVVSSQTLHKQVKFFMKFAGPKLLRWLSRFYLPIGKRVIVIGGLIQGCETAEFLVKLGRKVTVVETSDKLGTGTPEVNRPRLLWWLAKNNVFLLSGVTYDEITDTGLNIITKEGERQALAADTILAVIPPSPNIALFEALKGKVPDVYLIGDSKHESHLILGAVSDGSEVARAI